MAREAGFPDYAMGLASEDAWQKTERFAALVAEAEREAICELADNLLRTSDAVTLIDAIRARGDA